MGGPTGLETLACMEQQLRDWNETTAADFIPTAVDGYLREQDGEQLCGEDVVFHGSDVVLRLGRSDRGESVKTGRNQGVRIDRQYVKDILQRRVAALKKRHPNDWQKKKVCPITKARYRTLWERAGRAVGVNPGPPHGARHTGASLDAATGYRTMLQIQRRGRWTADRSVLRYARTHDWVLAESQQPAHVRSRGSQLLQGRGSRPEMAQE